MKKIILFILTVAMSISLLACGESKPQTAEFDSTITTGDFEITVNSDILTATQLNGDTDQYEEFLTTDMTNYGDEVLCDVTLVAKEGYTQVVIQYSVKNIGKEDSVLDESISLNYNDGYTYDVNEQYWIMGETDDWHKFTTVKLSPLSTIQCKAYFYVPEEVFSNTDSSLKLNIGNYEYTIR